MAELPFVVFYPAILSAAWVGGLWPGVLATILSAAAASYLSGSFALGGVSDGAALVVFVSIGTLISALNEAWRRAIAAVAESERQQGHGRLKAEHANHEKDEFLAVVSHELRTPLNAILGWAKILTAGNLSPDRTRHAAETIARNAHAEARVVESLLDLSRIHAGTFALELSSLDLSSAVRSAVETMSSTARNIALTVDIADDPIIIQGDTVRLYQIVWNILTNAIKFTPPHGYIAVRVRRVGATAELEIADTGQGIPVELLPHVFERFRQGDNTTPARQRGLGLGLALVRELTEAHGGSVRAVSDGIGRGTTVTVTLPIQLESDAALDERTQQVVK
jgi:signal transduction histidine kinase